MVQEKLEGFDPDGQFETEVLSKKHDRNGFHSGNEALDRYLKQIASQDVKRGLAIVHVLVAKDAPQKILGFYTLSNESIELDTLPEALSRKLPPHRKVPVTLLGQLAVDKSAQGKGLGQKLIADAFNSAKEASQTSATYALVTDAIDQEVEKFYRHMSFSKLKKYERRLILPLK